MAQTPSRLIVQDRICILFQGNLSRYFVGMVLNPELRVCVIMFTRGIIIYYNIYIIIYYNLGWSQFAQ